MLQERGVPNASALKALPAMGADGAAVWQRQQEGPCWGTVWVLLWVLPGLTGLGSEGMCRLWDVSRASAVFLKLPLQQGKPSLGPRLERDSIIGQSDLCWVPHWRFSGNASAVLAAEVVAGTGAVSCTRSLL